MGNKSAKRFKDLDAYYIESRYPPEVKDYSRKECKEVLEVAQELTQFIINKIT
ncbi:HEPN domain-containing protein [Patescibacteria group bacterium]|nr:HEPN domain-containing protein [Patescibacteria group bacterium]